MHTRTVPAYVDIDQIIDGTYALTLRHHKHGGQWAKFKCAGGGNLLKRAVQAVYDNNDGDADAFFHAQGMSDAEAFDAKTWTGRSPCPNT